MQNIQDNQEQSFSTKTSRLGRFILNQAHLEREKATLVDHAKADATSQFLQLKDTPGKELRFGSANISALITSNDPLQMALIKDKAVEKELDEQFWATVSDHEAQNESDFAAFWLERVLSRSHIYIEGLSAIEDPKLRDQLVELLVSYLQTELLPEALSKSRSQNLVLSRKTRKNTSKLETVLKGSKMDIAGVQAILDKFNKKQGILDPDRAKVDMVKKMMIGDMVRRMQKQKQSDSPVLFLTLILILFARQYDGVVYATGKFAPKLLKQLKSVIEPEQYNHFEKWKEAAKAGNLNAEDRQEMKKLAEV